ERLRDDAILVADDGNHTFLSAELFPVRANRSFICPTDFNAMGYCVPAVIGAKLANPSRQVVGIVGGGGFMMTCMEILTARNLELGVIYFVFNDGELGQIAQFQKVPLNRKTCTLLHNLNLAGVAQAVGAFYVEITSDLELEVCLQKAFE